MANISQISLKVCGNPDANSGFQPMVIFNSPSIEIKDAVYAGFDANSYFFTIKIEKNQVVYKLVKNNVSSLGASRQGCLFIGIAIPKGYKLDAGVSPYDVLMELKKAFLSRCMTCKDPATEKYEFSSNRVQPNILDDIAETYTLVPVQMSYHPMNTNAPIAYVTTTEDKIELLMKDVQYPGFAKYSEIVVAETVQSTSYISISNITIPRMPEYTVYEDGVQTSVLSDPKQAYTVKGKGDPRFYDNGSLTFSLEELLIGDIIPNVSIDKANEIININTQSLVKPKTCTVNVVFEPKEAETYFYTKRNEWNLFCCNRPIQFTKDLSLSFSGESISALYNYKNFNIIQYRKDEYVVTKLTVDLNEIKVFADKVRKPVTAGVYGGGQPQECLINACEVRLLMDSEYVRRSSQCSFMFYNSEDRLLQETTALFSRAQGGNVLATAYIPKSWASSQVQVRIKFANEYFDFGNLCKDKNGVIDLRDMEYTRKSIGLFSKYSRQIKILILIFISIIIGLVAGAYTVKYLQETDNENVRYTCSDCDNSFSTQEDLSNHKNKHHSDGLPFNPPAKTFNCTNCNEGPFTENELADHMLTCPQRVKCDKCDQKFASESERSEHMISEHLDQNQTNVKCTKCGSDFESTSALNAHNENKHASKSCQYCDQTFEGKQALTNHMNKSHHFQCDECGQDTWFYTEKELNDHKRNNKNKQGRNHSR